MTGSTPVLATDKKDGVLAVFFCLCMRSYNDIGRKDVRRRTIPVSLLRGGQLIVSNYTVVFWPIIPTPKC